MIKIVKLIGLSCLSVIVIFAFFECGLRFYKQGDKSRFWRLSSNETLYYELAPGSVIRRRIGVRINSGGFRDREYPKEKPRGVKRIVVLGDSEVFSMHLELEETLPKQIEAILNAEQDGSLRYEVLNMGVLGYNTVQELEFLKTRGLAYDPDLVILYYVLGDASDVDVYFSRNVFTRHSLAVRYAAKKLKLRRARMNWLWRRRGVKTIGGYFRYLYKGTAGEETGNALLEMAAVCEAHGAPLVTVINPVLSGDVRDFSSGYSYRWVHEKLLALKHPNLTVLDPLSAFQEHGGEVSDYRQGPKDAHKNAMAHGLTARFICRSLKELELL